MIPETTGLFHMLMSAGPVVKLVLLLLFFFSITSWSIIFIKYRYIKKAYRESVEFTDIFWKSRNLMDAFSRAKIFRSSPVARIFVAGYMEVKQTSGSAMGAERAGGDRQVKKQGLQVMGSVKRALRRSINVEVRRLSQLIPFLATAGNTAPFIGLFGTVWGIMDTFQGIGVSGSASLAVVAPGISEALVATAAGLAVAIPSVMAYNYFTDKIRVLDSELQSFSADFLNIIERDILRQQGGMMETNFGRDQLMSDINVTPFVDVMLVLLIIFMVTAPMMVQGVDVDLPKAASGPLKGEEEQLVISVDKAHQVYINDQAVGVDFLTQKLGKILENLESRNVYLRADKDVPYGVVVNVMSRIKMAGVDTLGMITLSDEEGS